MTRSENAEEFLRRLREIDYQYETLFRPQLASVEAELSSKGLPRSRQIDESLEVHSRTYIVNAWLAALNWRMTIAPHEGLPNLIPESSVSSLATGNKRFMDYLGIEGDSPRPLLLVETKRPMLELPTLKATSGDFSPEEVIVRGLNGEALTGEWNKWLSEDVGDYVRSVHQATGKTPARVVITNGNWLVLFWDPVDAFLPNGSRDLKRVIVCRDRAAIEESAVALFERLEHSRVLGGVRPLRVPELLFYVTADYIDAAMHGLYLLYDEERGIHAPTVPRIKVAPVVFLRSRFGAWFCVEEGTKDYELPHDQASLTPHLTEVQAAAEGLLAQINQRLNATIVSRGVAEHYDDSVSFDVLRGVVEKGRSGNRYLLVTGDDTHYVRPSARPACPFHDYAEAQRAGRPSELIAIRNTRPRAFFHTKEEHHCAHADVSLVKASAVSAENESRCGPRSRGRGFAFCEIWPIETHLCCRSCAYERVCTRSKVFHLPCSGP